MHKPHEHYPLDWSKLDVSHYLWNYGDDLCGWSPSTQATCESSGSRGQVSRLRYWDEHDMLISGALKSEVYDNAEI